MEVNPLTSVSVIIPTYNRKDSLLNTLDSLRQQTYPTAHYEVIVVDDGSTDGTENLAWSEFPFQVQYVRQENAGATKARNTGASASSAQTLVFMDDDILATPPMLAHLVQEMASHERTITMATLVPSPAERTPFAVMYSRGAVFPKDVDTIGPNHCQETNSWPGGCFVHFARCKTGVLAIDRQDFFSLDMFQDPTGGWPNWDDVDFGYRAHLHGFRLWRSYRAIAYHQDYSLESLEASCNRYRRASRSAAWLFVRYPEIKRHTSYGDKAPMSLSGDPLGLLTRKALRNVAWSPQCVFVMKRLTGLLEQHRPDSVWLARFYRWIISAAIYQGYQQGLRELAEER